MYMYKQFLLLFAWVSEYTTYRIWYSEVQSRFGFHWNQVLGILIWELLWVSYELNCRFPFFSSVFVGFGVVFFAVSSKMFSFLPGTLVDSSSDYSCCLERSLEVCKPLTNTFAILEACWYRTVQAAVVFVERSVGSVACPHPWRRNSDSYVISFRSFILWKSDLLWKPLSHTTEMVVLCGTSFV